MNFEYFIAKRIARNTTGSFSGNVIKISIAAVALSVFIMIISTFIVNGFQAEIEKKLFGFWGHIQVVDYNTSNFNDAVALTENEVIVDSLKKHPNIASIHRFANKSGILKTKNGIEGIVLKGVGKDFDWSFLREKMVDGNILEITEQDTSRMILISQTTANRLKVKVGDPIRFYFIKKNTRGRKLKVGGIYHTGMEEYDKVYGFVDIHQIQKLNNWAKFEISGYELKVKDINQLRETDEEVFKNLPLHLKSESLLDIFPTMFDWIELTVRNKYMIMIMVIIVTSLNMITVLLILILERTKMIGILKALGASNWSIQKIFLYNITYITLWGVGIGNILALSAAYIQAKFEIIPLPEKSYYLNSVPILIELKVQLMLNAIALTAIVLILFLPTLLVKNIRPIKAIRFD